MDGMRKEGHNIKLSKSLSHLLRHAAPKEKLCIHPGGYIEVEAILHHPRFKHYTIDNIRAVVENNDKQRFSLVEKRGKLMIRANQGHTFPVDEEELLEPIAKPEEYPVVIHGTYRRFWTNIEHTGLSRKARNHIHFAPGEPGAEGVISGMRNSVELYIYINIEQAIQDGIKFYRSSNNVILTSGNELGLLEPKYFAKVKDLRSKTIIYPPTGSGANQ